MIILWFFFVCFSEDGAVHICFCISRTGIIFHIYVMFHDVIILTFIHSCICLRISSHQIKIPSNEWMSKWLNWSNYSLTFKYSLWTHNIFYAYLQKNVAWDDGDDIHYFGRFFIGSGHKCALDVMHLRASKSLYSLCVSLFFFFHKHTHMQIL